MVSIIANSADLDEMPILLHLIWFLTGWKSHQYTKGVHVCILLLLFASIMMPIGDPHDRFFYLILTLMIDSYNLCQNFYDIYEFYASFGLAKTFILYMMTIFKCKLSEGLVVRSLKTRLQGTWSISLKT